MWDIYSLIFSCKHYIWEGRLEAVQEFYIYLPAVMGGCQSEDGQEEEVWKNVLPQ